jgi:hypothetical protein
MQARLTNWHLYDNGESLDKGWTKFGQRLDNDWTEYFISKS